ncbi:uncharacterized protein B0H18DRAFT_1127893 [Fomitopsis serialis]|uniref:uncharacterized protein n=1 Tax=Fomitopsis serialis TaxID=139415 RepID=UPI0020088D4F|nr:uncharacterized protein B0H18DRAFT_1127893 [Neoantrodia serialis]KAH9911872.1 hypothetical protein B0H18DRAFT_1127893 [Neoantrodia serialis]
MDKASSVLAALNAGKIPSSAQLATWVDAALDSAVLRADPSADGGSELSQQGKALQNGLRDVLVAWKQLGESKNGDNLLQESLWHLSAADLSSTTANVDVDTDQAHRDARNLARALRTLVSVVGENIAQEGRSVFHDFASFSRLALADAAEYVADGAHKTAEGLRELDSQVDAGERNEVGVRKRKADEVEEEDQDARAKFERGMDKTKVVGGKAIGAGQAAVDTAEDVANRTTTRLEDAFNKICDRAQEDEQYHSAVSTLFDVAHKWIHRSLDSAGDVNRDTSLEAFINDPTPEQHLLQGIRGLRAVLERLAGGKSLDGLFGAVRVCGVDVQQDESIRSWCDSALEHARKCVDEQGYVRSEEAKERGEALRREGRELADKDSDEGRKWKEDVGEFRREAAEFEQAMERDEELRKVRTAHRQLGDDIEESLVVAGSAGLQTLMEKAPWFWQDLFNFYLPKAVGMLKDIPIPRTEYKDSEVEFVLEDLDISSFGLLPGHAYIRNITDIDIQAPSSGQTNTAVGSLTRIYIQALHLALREVSFYYKDKTAAVGPAEFTGMLAFTLPPQGIDLDVVVRSIPNSAEGLKERARRGGFLEVQRVEARVSEDVEVRVTESNHSVLVSVFRPVMVGRFRDALRVVLEQQVRAAIEAADALLWDVGKRADVFGDAGLGRGAALVAGFWSELGHLRKTGEGGGVLGGWRATGTGVVKRDGEAQFAMGAEPQVLGGEKRGPKGTLSESVAERYDLEGKKEAAAETGGQLKGVAEQAKEGVKEGVRKVRGFGEAVERKTEEERGRDGWQSSAFDVSA